MVRPSSSRRFLMLQVSISSFIILWSSNVYVTGQPVLTTGLANCGDDVKLTCSQPGFDSTLGRLWKKGGVTISETGNDESGTDRYSEKSTSDDFSLVISNAKLADVDNYTCEYQFQPSNAESLSFECKPTEWGVDVTRNNQKKLHVRINNIYPNSITAEVECALQGKSPVAIKGTQEAATQNGDHYDVTWVSDGIITSGTHDCTITVVTSTSTEIIKTGLTFSDPSLVVDFKKAVIGVSSGLGASVILFIIVLIPMCCALKTKTSKLPAAKHKWADEQKKGLRVMTILAEESQTFMTDLSQPIEGLQGRVKIEKNKLEVLKREHGNAVSGWKYEQREEPKKTIKAETRLADMQNNTEELSKQIEELQRQLQTEEMEVKDLQRKFKEAISVLQDTLDKEQKVREKTVKSLEESEKKIETISTEIEKL